MILKNKLKIQELFSKPSRKISTPNIHSRFVPGDGEVLISVPVKNFKRAVDRNRIKRIIKESLRKREWHMTGAFIYISKEMVDFKTIETDIDKIFKTLSGAPRL